MRTEHTGMAWLEERQPLSFAELAERSGLTEAELRRLVDEGALSPIDPQGAQWTFSGHWAVTVRSASRLHHDFELPPESLALTLTCLERIRELETELRELRARLPHGAP